ncbi:MAG: phosphopantetheine-binding protein [Planctomycetota bacterium]|jgi:acyl carrier protein
MNIEKQSLTREEILGQTRLLLEAWLDNIDLASLDEQTNLLTDLGLDSVTILQLVLGIEKEFNVTIKDHELDSEVFLKMANLIDIIEGKLSETD